MEPPGLARFAAKPAGLRGNAAKIAKSMFFRAAEGL